MSRFYVNIASAVGGVGYGLKRGMSRIKTVKHKEKSLYFSNDPEGTLIEWQSISPLDGQVFDPLQTEISKL